MQELLGLQGRDVVTGFTGKVVAQSQYFGGIERVELQPELSFLGKYEESRWFDLHRVSFPELEASQAKADAREDSENARAEEAGVVEMAFNAGVSGGQSTLYQSCECGAEFEVTTANLYEARVVIDRWWDTHMNGHTQAA